MGGFQKKYNGSWESSFNNNNSKFSSASTLNLNMPIQTNNQNPRRNSHYEQSRPRQQNDYANQRINSSIAKTTSRPCDLEKAFKSHMQNNYNKPGTSNQQQQQQLTNNRNLNNNFRGARNSVCVRNPPPNITVNQLDTTYYVPKASEIPKPSTTTLSLVKVEPEVTLMPDSGNLSGRPRRSDNDDTLVDENNNNAAKKFRQAEINSLNEAARSHEPVKKCERATQYDPMSFECPWNRERDLFLIRETMREFSRTFPDQFANQFIKRSLEVGRELRMNHADLANGMAHLLESAHSDLLKSHHETTFSKEAATFTKPTTPITPQSESTRVGNVSCDQTVLIRNMSKPANSSSPYASDFDLGNTKDVSSKQGFTDFSDINSFTH